jgi:hypothetical protein
MPHPLRPRIAAAAQNRCGYCQTQERISGVPLTVEHIIPKNRGGSDAEDNLWLSCRLCNEAKRSLVEATDSLTQTMTPLFDPRIQAWDDHFCWDNIGTRIEGKTPTGRATVATLALNDEFRVRSRELWIEAGWHPPRD